MIDSPVRPSCSPPLAAAAAPLVEGEVRGGGTVLKLEGFNGFLWKFTEYIHIAVLTQRAYVDQDQVREAAKKVIS